MTILNYCCCCITLRHGGVLIGLLALIGALIAVSVFGISFYETFQDSFVYNNLNEQSGSSMELNTEEQVVYLWGARLWLIFYIGAALILVLFSLFLIYGSLAVSFEGLSF